jgi:hypothetical protein
MCRTLHPACPAGLEVGSWSTYYNLVCRIVSLHYIIDQHANDLQEWVAADDTLVRILLQVPPVKISKNLKSTKV